MRPFPHVPLTADCAGRRERLAAGAVQMTQTLTSEALEVLLGTTLVCCWGLCLGVQVVESWPCVCFLAIMSHEFIFSAAPEFADVKFGAALWNDSVACA